MNQTAMEKVIPKILDGNTITISCRRYKRPTRIEPEEGAGWFARLTRAFFNYLRSRCD